MDAPHASRTDADAGPTRRVLADARTAASRLQERRETIRERISTLADEIALAKGRIALKDEVQGLLGRLQAASSRRNLESFEAILSAIVSEVIPKANPIAFDLSTERGQPSLAISTRRSDGSRGRIFENHGGALDNVVSTGLRLLAVVKSKGARFVAFDEPDNWIDDANVARFFQVLERTSEELGLQCFVISHHDVTRLETSIRVSRIAGSPDSPDGVTIVSGDQPPVWDDDAPGFRYVRLLDVQSMVDATIHLSPGINALVGPNEHGKSIVIRALRAAFYGDLDDELIRTGRDRMRMEFGWSRGRFLRVTRQMRRNPVNLWSLHEADGSVVTEDGMTFETGGRDTPAWVSRRFGILRDPERDIDIHLSHQKRTSYLIDKPGSTRAAILSIGQESDYIADMLTVFRRRLTEDAACVRRGEPEYATLQESLATLEPLDGIATDIGRLSSREEEIRSDILAEKGASDMLGRLDRAHDALADAMARAAILEELPEAGTHPGISGNLSAGTRTGATLDRIESSIASRADAVRRVEACDAIPATVPSVEDTVPVARGANAIISTRRILDHALRHAAIVAVLPEDRPDLPEGDRTDAIAGTISGLGEKVRRLHVVQDLLGDLPTELPDIAPSRDPVAAIETLRSLAEGAGARLGELDGRIAELRETLQRALDAGGGTCPTCGQHATATDLLEGRHGDPA